MILYLVLWSPAFNHPTDKPGWWPRVIVLTEQTAIDFAIAVCEEEGGTTAVKRIYISKFQLSLNN